MKSFIVVSVVVLSLCSCITLGAVIGNVIADTCGPTPLCAAPPPWCNYVDMVDENGCFTCGRLVCPQEPSEVPLE
ncbi:hypothetical protein Bpfe_004264 [Biomphalaria pfeifferi]|uniref:Uncharacterized protein n=1 Tax=Biomphalaria pfeifferi TaxID=112525 RepID=A0AAD8C5R2_BIOPF|nr:hypothetical protein Bpfe_004264 [Biomphalaria pfeifferi]